MDQETIATMLNGAIVTYGVVVAYTQRGWIPYLAERVKNWSPSLSLPSFTTSKTPTLQDAATNALALRDYFDYYECPEGAEYAIKCGELLSHAMFCRKGSNAPKT